MFKLGIIAFGGHAVIVMLLVPIVTLIIWNPELGFNESSGLIGVFILNVFFAMLFRVSGLSFKKVNENENSLKKRILTS